MKIGDAIETMRGWGRITLGSTRLSDMGTMRKAIAQTFAPWGDDQQIAWEIVIRIPPEKKARSKR